MEDLRIGPRLTIPATELHESFARSGGPGGQHVNRTESKVELRWSIADSAALDARDRAWLLQRLASRLNREGELLVVSERTRNQVQNRSDARDKLAELVREALVRPKVRRPTRPRRGAVERRLTDKKRRGQLKRQRRTGGDD